ncbi:MAG: DUF3617 domain-containing protein [Pseudomonadota bacterium]
MNSRLIFVAVLSLSAVTALPAAAQTMKPGLWEVNTKMTGQDDPRMKQMRQEQQKNMAEMRKQYDSMPPEQRKHMDAMMARMGQLNMNEDGGMTIKTCVTPEMAAMNRMETQHQQRHGCTDTRSPMVGGVMKVSFSCTNPKSSGEGTVRVTGNSSYTMDMTMHSEHEGKVMATAMAASGKWLSSDCGDVKPPPMPPAAKK